MVRGLAFLRSSIVQIAQAKPNTMISLVSQLTSSGLVLIFVFEFVQYTVLHQVLWRILLIKFKKDIWPLIDLWSTQCPLNFAMPIKLILSLNFCSSRILPQYVVSSYLVLFRHRHRCIIIAITFNTIRTLVHQHSNQCSKYKYKVQVVLSLPTWGYYYSETRKPKPIVTIILSPFRFLL